MYHRTLGLVVTDRHGVPFMLQRVPFYAAIDLHNDALRTIGIGFAMCFTVKPTAVAAR